MKNLMKVLALIALVSVGFVAPAFGQGYGLIAPGHVIGNGTTTNPRTPTDASLSSVMDQLCGNNGSIFERITGVWGCLNLGTGVATALGNAVTGSGGIVLATSPSLTTPSIAGATWSGTWAGTPTFSGANFIALSNIAQDPTAYSLLGNTSGSAGNYAPFTIGSLTQKASPAGTDLVLIQDQAASGAFKYATVGSIASAGSVGSFNTQTGAITFNVAPQGRLTLSSHTPVMTSSQTAKSTIYYDAYMGNQVPLYNGTADTYLTIGSNETSLTLEPSGTGVENANGVFDVWAINSSGLKICIATNGSGGGWASDTGGSNTTRGTGYTQLDNTTRAYITNKNAIAHCYNATTDYGSISANQATYLGTVMTDAAAAGSVSFTLGGTASGGSAAWIGIWNYYNQVPATTSVTDNQAGYTYSSATIRASGGSTNNRITAVFGAAEEAAQSKFNSTVQASSAAAGIIGICLDSTSAYNGRQAVTGGVTSQYVGGTAFFDSTPLLGQHYFQACENVPQAAAVTFNVSLTGIYQTLTLDWRY